MPAPTDPSCIFCKIIAGQIPCLKVFEDDVVLAFLDIGPLVTGHTLVIPKGHYPTIMETPEAVLGAINQRLPGISRAVLQATGLRACHVLANNGSDAMQTVPHLHYHIIPRFSGDGFHIPWNAKPLDKAAAAELAATITTILSQR
jgi:histidine triad (HIT) family protein